MRGQLEQVMGDLQKAREQIEKGYVQAAASIATSADPLTGAAAFNVVLSQITQESPMEEPSEPGMGQVPQQPADPVLQ